MKALTTNREHRANACQLPLGDLCRIAMRESQSTNPLFRVHRWFARRLCSQFRAILSGVYLPTESPKQFWDRYEGELDLTGQVILDPFVGGGTTAVEALKAGARIIACDIDPVAASITRFELQAASLKMDEDRIASICDPIADKLRPLHTTTATDYGEVPVLHHFWVELRDCSQCGEEFELHPHFRLAYDRDNGVQWAFCRRCHRPKCLPLDADHLSCSCGEETPVSGRTVSPRGVVCPRCSHKDPFQRLEPEGPPRWRLFAQEFLNDATPRSERLFKRVTDDDRTRYEEAQIQLAAFECDHGPFAPSRPVPEIGRSDRRPLNHGFRTYRELFNARQLLHLSLLGRAISPITDTDSGLAMAMAFSHHLTSNCMYTGYAFGYRRTSPLFSYYGFRHVVRPVEINPWLKGIGRGTYPNALRAVRRGIEYARGPSIKGRDGKQIPLDRGLADVRPVADPASVVDGQSRAAVLCRSAEALSDVPDQSVDLVLSDPPYFDNVSYSELSDFYLAWHQSLGIAPAPFDDPVVTAPLSENLAAKQRNPQAREAYAERLATVLGHCRRVLRPQGRMVLTFHHASHHAWAAFADALARAGMRCFEVLPMRAEGQGGLHAHPGNLRWDSVFVFQPGEAMDELSVTHGAMDASKQSVFQIRDDLEEQEVALSDADCLNLFRAKLVAHALGGGASRQGIPLIDALTLPFGDDESEAPEQEHGCADVQV